jgi:hypothetical protein
MIHLAIIILPALISFSGWALHRGPIKRWQSVPPLTSRSCRSVPFRAHDGVSPFATSASWCYRLDEPPRIS